MAETYCIGLANVAIDFVVGQPTFIDRTGECEQSLCGVPAGATPPLKPETVASSRPHLA
jgi:hypothetical protein